MDFLVTADTSRVETAWIDARRFGIPPCPVALPFVLSHETLMQACQLHFPADALVAISGVPWHGDPVPVCHADVVVVGTSDHQLWTMPLAALEKRINGISCLIIHQRGPRPTGRIVAFRDDTNSGSSRRLYCFQGLRIHWGSVRLAWQTETCQVVHTAHCILIAADMPPFPVAGHGVAPTARDVNCWYHSRFAQLYGDRTWRDSGLAFGDFSIMFDANLDATSRRPWITELGEAVDVVIAGSQGEGLERWPAPEGWAIRPVLVSGPIGQAAIQRMHGSVPALIHQPLPGEYRGDTVEIASVSSDDDVACVPEQPSVDTEPETAPVDAAVAAQLQSLIDDPPPLEEALAEAEAEPVETAWYSHVEAAAYGMNLLQRSSKLHATASVEATKPQVTDVLTVATPCRRRAHHAQSGARANVTEQAIRVAPDSEAKVICLSELLPVTAYCQTGPATIHASVDDLLCCLEPFRLEMLQLPAASSPFMHVAAQTWLGAMGTAVPGTAYDCVDLYTDGSFCPDTGHTGWSVLAVGRTPGEEVCLGALADTASSCCLVVGPVDAHIAEMIAMFHALAIVAASAHGNYRIIGDCTSVLDIAQAAAASQSARHVGRGHPGLTSHCQAAWCHTRLCTCALSSRERRERSC